MTLSVGLGDHGQVLARTALRQLESKAVNALHPARVNTDTSVATSSSKPRCTRPPLPEYSPSEFSRTTTQSIWSPLCSGLSPRAARAPDAR